jgi:hypothetical protein
MQIVPLANIPNQTLSITLDNNFWQIAVYAVCATYDEFGNASNVVMAMDLTLNNTPILTGQRVVANFRVIPYRYLESGNFIFDTGGNDMPDYTQFGITQNLLYYSQSELEVLRVASV